jgi:hypothetical protein
LTLQQLEILRHSLGTGEGGRQASHRNHFVTGAGGDDHSTCLQLVFMELMTQHPPSALTGGDDVFTVTKAGREAEASNRAPAPRLTRSQRRYRNFLAADCGMRFGEWLRGAR